MNILALWLHSEESKFAKTFYYDEIMEHFKVMYSSSLKNLQMIRMLDKSTISLWVLEKIWEKTDLLKYFFVLYNLRFLCRSQHAFEFVWIYSHMVKFLFGKITNSARLVIISHVDSDICRSIMLTNLYVLLYLYLYLLLITSFLSSLKKFCTNMKISSSPFCVF